MGTRPRHLRAMVGGLDRPCRFYVAMYYGPVHTLLMTNEITISGQRFVVLESKPYEHKGQQRTQLKLRKPRGQKVFHAFVYENGSISEAV